MAIIEIWDQDANNTVGFVEINMADDHYAVEVVESAIAKAKREHESSWTYDDIEEEIANVGGVVTWFGMFNYVAI